MITSFRDHWLESFFKDDVAGKRIPGDVKNSLFRRLQMLDDATCDKDLCSPPGNRFEKLASPLSGPHSIRINGQWRLIFAFDCDTGESSDVYLDPHTYR